MNKTIRGWTEEELLLLAKLWPTERDMDVILASFPGKSLTTIRWRAFRLGIRRPKRHLERGHNIIDSMSELDLSWLAGFIDGEGTIGLYRHPDGFVASVVISNTNLPVLLHVFRLTGCGGIYKKPTRKSGHVQGYHFRVNERTAVDALVRRLLPHLRIKKSQAELMIQVLEADKAGSMTKDTLERFLDKFGKLNGRGGLAVGDDPYSTLFQEYKVNRNRRRGR